MSDRLEIIGVAGTGIFNQSGGTNIANVELDVGGPRRCRLAASPADQSRLWNLQPQQRAIIAGDSGIHGQCRPGIFTQTGGTNTTPTITLAGLAIDD